METSKVERKMIFKLNINIAKILNNVKENFFQSGFFLKKFFQA